MKSTFNIYSALLKPFRFFRQTDQHRLECPHAEPSPKILPVETKQDHGTVKGLRLISGSNSANLGDLSATLPRILLNRKQNMDKVNE